jgi:hypothetical protein
MKWLWNFWARGRDGDQNESPDSDITTKSDQNVSPELARMVLECAQLELKVAELGLLIEKKRTRLDKLLYLPSGRVKSLPGEPALDFVVTAETAVLLNGYASRMRDQGGVPWLDLQHDKQTAVFWITDFSFSRDGVYANGRFTDLGKQLRNAGRISGVSISTPVVSWDSKPLAASCVAQIPKEDTARLEKQPMTVENLSDMGAILIDGGYSAIQPY